MSMELNNPAIAGLVLVRCIVDRSAPVVISARRPGAADRYACTCCHAHALVRATLLRRPCGLYCEAFVWIGKGERLLSFWGASICGSTRKSLTDGIKRWRGLARNKSGRSRRREKNNHEKLRSCSRWKPLQAISADRSEIGGTGLNDDVAPRGTKSGIRVCCAWVINRTVKKLQWTMFYEKL